jgi:hypothetical protein
MTNDPLTLFRDGLDTTDICERLGGIKKGWTEAKVYNAIARAKADGREQNTTTAPVAYAPPLVKYAGYDPNTVPWAGR